MSKPKTIYVCSNCGAEFPTWQGKCSACGEWNTLVAEKRGGKGKRADVKAALLEDLSKVSQSKFSRTSTGISEFDRVLGGGIVKGSLILLGGNPGIGKSTLVLEGAAHLVRENSVLYVSGEESAGQVKMRAERLGLDLGRLDFLSERNVDLIAATIEKVKPDLVIIDSIQTMYSEEAPGEAGGITQVRFATQKLMETAKRNSISVILIGHVTKQGNVAGPKTLEHLVDAVLYLEGDRYHNMRILRGVKNRFGSTDESGVFAMTTQGLTPVPNPSLIFLEERKAGLPGSCVSVTQEGVRAFLVEVQALSSPTVFGYPKRRASGLGLRRVELIIAVLTKRAGLRLGNQDVYVSVAGGFKISEPAIDLAIALSIFSAYSNKALDPAIVALGEVGLSGEVRTIRDIDKRIKEAGNLGFKKIIVPASTKVKKADMEIIKVITVKEAIGRIS